MESGDPPRDRRFLPPSDGDSTRANFDQNFDRIQQASGTGSADAGKLGKTTNFDSSNYAHFCRSVPTLPGARLFLLGR
jgi:hypothetical protein